MGAGIPAGMIERAQRFMPNSSPSPGHFSTANGMPHTPRTPLTARRAASLQMQVSRCRYSSKISVDFSWNSCAHFSEPLPVSANVDSPDLESNWPCKNPTPPFPSNILDMCPCNCCAVTCLLNKADNNSLECEEGAGVGACSEIAGRWIVYVTQEGGASSGEEESEVDRRQRELYSKQQHLLREQRFADQERLLGLITGETPQFPLPFSFLPPSDGGDGRKENKDDLGNGGG